MHLIYCKATVAHVLNPDLNELTVAADLRSSGGERKQKAALPLLGFDPENTESTCPRRPGKAVSK